MYSSEQAAFDACQIVPPGAMRACKPIPAPSPGERRRQMEFMRRMIQQIDAMRDEPTAQRRAIPKKPAAPKAPAPRQAAAVQADLIDGMNDESGATEAAESGGDDDGGGDGDPDPEERNGNLTPWIITAPGIDDLIIQREDLWVTTLWAALENQTRKQVLISKCPQTDLDIIRCLVAQTKSGRCRKTEVEAVARVAESIRAQAKTPGPRAVTRDIHKLLTQRPEPLAPSRRGRPKGSKTKKQGGRAVQIEMFVTGGDK